MNTSTEPYSYSDDTIVHFENPNITDFSIHQSTRISKKILDDIDYFVEYLKDEDGQPLFANRAIFIRSAIIKYCRELNRG